jgi:immunity protein, SdpI family
MTRPPTDPGVPPVPDADEQPDPIDPARLDVRSMIRTSVAIVAGMVLLGAWAWLQLPPDAQVPIHWGADGQADDWANKTIGLFLTPAIAVGLVLLFAIIPRIEPRRANLERSAKAYAAVWLGTLALIGGLQVLIVFVALGGQIDMTRLVMIGTGVLFVVIGNYLPKVRSNYLVGIRTPWTLTSDVSWTKTHRAGGRLFVVIGIAMLVLGLIGVPGSALVGVLVGSIIVLVGFTVVYSYRVWKDDPAKRAI